MIYIQKHLQHNTNRHLKTNVIYNVKKRKKKKTIMKSEGHTVQSSHRDKTVLPWGPR